MISALGRFEKSDHLEFVEADSRTPDRGEFVHAVPGWLLML
jgi:hypothetical protein